MSEESRIVAKWGKWRIVAASSGPSLQVFLEDGAGCEQDRWFNATDNRLVKTAMDDLAGLLANGDLRLVLTAEEMKG